MPAPSLPCQIQREARDCREGNQRCARARHRVRQIEDGQRRERGHQAKERDDTAVAGGGVDRQHQRREARRMYRIDLPVQSALHVVGTERWTGPEGLVVAFDVVVLDLQVAIGNEAVRDDQVVRLVAPRPDRSGVQGAEHQIEGEAAAEDRKACRFHVVGGVATACADPPGS